MHYSGTPVGNLVFILTERIYSPLLAEFCFRRKATRSDYFPPKRTHAAVVVVRIVVVQRTVRIDVPNIVRVNEEEVSEHTLLSRFTPAAFARYFSKLQPYA